MNDSHQRPPVAVFDAAFPPGVAMIRSLGGAGVEVRAFDHVARASGRFSRRATSFALAPDPSATDEFIDWLHERVDDGTIGLVAPTSDHVAYAAAVVGHRVGVDLSGGVGGHRGVDAVLDCLFKDRFAARLDELGFPTPAWAAPTNVDEAADAAGRIGYPVVLKPRSHVGVGATRGAVAREERELRALWEPHPSGPGREAVFERHPGLDLPLVQQMIEGSQIECVSISGFVERGQVTAASTIRKVDQWGGRLDVGTAFEVTDDPSWLGDALALVEKMLDTGIFELELLVDRSTGEYWAIDLNPRGYGQISLDIRRGNDLPVLWYANATGAAVHSTVRPDLRVRRWRMAVPFYAGIAVSLALGPHRAHAAGALMRALSSPAAGAVHSWRDPLPGVAMLGWLIRHPRGLVRPHVAAANERRMLR